MGRRAVAEPLAFFVTGKKFQAIETAHEMQVWRSTHESAKRASRTGSDDSGKMLAYMNRPDFRSRLLGPQLTIRDWNPATRQPVCC